jgi:hypothetical protein
MMLYCTITVIKNCPILFPEPVGSYLFAVIGVVMGEQVDIRFRQIFRQPVYGIRPFAEFYF